MKSLILSVFVIMAVSFCLILYGCTSTGGSGPDSPPDIGDYFPLGVGYWWTYIEYDADGNQTGTHTTEFISSHTFPSGTVLYLYIDEPGNYEGHALKEDGLYHYSDDNLDESNLVKAIGNPVEEGDEILTEDGNLFTIVELDVGVTVPAGYFRCIEVKRENEAENEVDYYYLGLNAGLVKTESWEDGVYSGHSDLFSYFDEPQPPPYLPDYYPLGMGYSWTYEEFDPQGNSQGTYVRRINSTHTFPSGVTVYLTNDGPDWYFGATFKDDGLYVLDGPELDEMYLYKVANIYPEVGDVFIAGAVTVETVSLNETVNIGMGTYHNCIELKATDNGTGDWWKSYLAFGIGTILNENYNQNGGLDGTEELVGYDFDGGGSPDIADYWPLAVGNHWDYQMYDENHNPSGIESLQIVEVHQLSPGVLMYEHEGAGPEGVALLDDGLYEWDGEGYTTADIVKFINRFPEVGEVVNFPTGGYCQVVSLDTNLVTMAGTFDCIQCKYVGEPGENWWYFFLEEDVGMVFVEVYNSSGEFGGAQELMSYDLMP